MTEQLMCRVMRSKDEVRIRRWIETEARLDVRDKFSMTALLYCAKFGLTNAISMLLQRQIPLHSRNRVGDNALHIASQEGHMSIVEMILGSIDDSQLKQELLDKQNDHGNTPLHYACFWKYSELAVLLSDQGAQITKKNRYQKTPLDFAGEQLSALLQLKNVKIDRRPVTTITGVVSDMQEKIELREAEFESKTKQLAEGRRKLIELHPSRVHFQDLLWTTQFYQMYSGRCNGSPVIIKRINTTVTPEAFHTSRELLFPMGGVFHENLAHLVGVCYEMDLVCAVFEYKDQQPLTMAQVIHDAQLNLSVDQLVGWMLQIAGALHFLHHRNIFHLALCTRNVLLNHESNVCLVDSGLANTIFGEFHQESFRIYEPEIVPPEGLLFGAINGFCFINFGILLWEMSTRQVPFQGMNAMHIGLRVVLEDFRPPIPEYLPAPLTHLIQLCWDAELKKRQPFVKILQQLELLKAKLETKV